MAVSGTGTKFWEKFYRGLTFAATTTPSADLVLESGDSSPPLGASREGNIDTLVRGSIFEAVMIKFFESKVSNYRLSEFR